MLALGVAQQLPVPNQIPGVLVIRGDVHVLATGVQLGRRPEQQPPLPFIVVEQAVGLVVEAQGMGRHPIRPPPINAVVARQMQHRAFPDRALEGEAIAEQIVAQHPVHDQPLAQGPLAHHQLLRPQHRHRRLQDQRARHDDFGAAIIDRRQGTALLGRQQQQPLHQLIDPLAAEAIAAQLERRLGILGRGQGSQSHGGAAGAHHHRAFATFEGPLHLGHRRIKRSLDVGL